MCQPAGLIVVTPSEQVDLASGFDYMLGGIASFETIAMDRRCAAGR
jgi:hypothetical protein